MQLLIPEIKFDSSIAEAGGKDGGNAGNVAAIPSFFAVKMLNDRTRIGFSITGPLGGGMNYGDDFVGRYGAQKIELTGLAVSPSLAYRVTDRLSLGWGVSALYTTSMKPSPSTTLGPCLTARSNWRTWTTGACSRLLGLTFQATDQSAAGGRVSRQGRCQPQRRPEYSQLAAADSRTHGQLGQAAVGQPANGGDGADVTSSTTNGM